MSQSEAFRLLGVTPDTPWEQVQEAYDSTRRELEATGEWGSRSGEFDSAYSELAARLARMIPTRAVAERLGVSPAAVANYARRYKGDFPAGHSRGRERLYDPEDVKAWARRRDRDWYEPGQAAPSADVPSDWAIADWRDVPTLVRAAVAGGDEALRERLRFGTAPDALRTCQAQWASWWANADLDPRPDDLLAAAAKKLSAAGAEQAERTLRREVDQARQAQPDIARERVEADLASLRGRHGRTSAYSSEHALIEWVLAAAAPIHGAVLDPASGTGGFLCAIADRYPSASVTGIDVDPTAAWRATVRLRAHGSQGQVTVGDALHMGSDLGTYSTVLIDPPPDSHWHWAELAGNLLDPDGRAVVTVPLRALEDVQLPADVAERIAAVIGLPSNVRTGKSSDFALLVLGKQPVDQVHFVSGRDLETHARRQHGPEAWQEPALAEVATILAQPDTASDYARTVASSTLAHRRDWSMNLLGLSGARAGASVTASVVRTSAGALRDLLESSGDDAAHWEQLVAHAPWTSLAAMERQQHLHRDAKKYAAHPGLLITTDHAEPVTGYAEPNVPRGALLLRLVDGSDAMAWALAGAANTQLSQRSAYRLPVAKLLNSILVPDLWRVLDENPERAASLERLYDSSRKAHDYALQVSSFAGQAPTGR